MVNKDVMVMNLNKLELLCFFFCFFFPPELIFTMEHTLAAHLDHTIISCGSHR